MRCFNYKALVMTTGIMLATFASISPAAVIENNKFKYPFYIGLSGGFGVTTWDGLIPEPENLNFAMILATPSHADEGGLSWGVFAGYEISPYFALEATYSHYPDAKVYFNDPSFFSIDYFKLTEFMTHTESVSLMGKIMLMIPSTSVRVYSSLGATNLHRKDLMINDWLVHPIFGAGANYNFTEHIMGEVGGTFTVGNGESELNPAEDYFPFLYSFFVRVAYRF